MAEGDRHGKKVKAGRKSPRKKLLASLKKKCLVMEKRGRRFVGEKILAEGRKLKERHKADIRCQHGEEKKVRKRRREATACVGGGCCDEKPKERKKNLFPPTGSKLST